MSTIKPASIHVVKDRHGDGLRIEVHPSRQPWPIDIHVFGSNAVSVETAKRVIAALQNAVAEVEAAMPSSAAAVALGASVVARDAIRARLEHERREIESRWQDQDWPSRDAPLTAEELNAVLDGTLAGAQHRLAHAVEDLRDAIAASTVGRFMLRVMERIARVMP